jgi:hypothetical protein
MVTSITGKDTIIIDGRILNDLAVGDCAALTFPNDLIQLKTGKNGNTLYGFNHSGRQCQLILRVVRGSGDDRFLNKRLSMFKNAPAAFTLMTGQMTKNVGDGRGNVSSDTYTLSGGAFKKETQAKENADGEIEQSESIYELTFSNAPRSIS